MTQTSREDLITAIRSGTEQCVACGLCLPYCPTYRLQQREFESPRGRLSLLDALAQGKLADIPATIDLLDHCLLCRSCEKHCPSLVPFASLMDLGHRLAVEETRYGVKLSRKLADYALSHPSFIRWLGRIAGRADSFLPTTLAKRYTALKYLPQLDVHAAWQGVYPGLGEVRGRVGLFLGCIARVVDQQTIDAAIGVLAQQGFDVVVPPGQACCGALSLHTGRLSAAEAMMERNAQSFNSEGLDVIVHMASGCGATLQEYDQHLDDDTGFSDMVVEICAFLDHHWRDHAIEPAADLHIMLHAPCTLDNCMADPAAPARLLSRLPGARITPLDNDFGCCGAAGIHMLTQTQTANTLRAPLLERIEQERPDVVVTTNPGCAMHLRQGLMELKLDVPVRHPVSLLLDRIT